MASMDEIAKGIAILSQFEPHGECDFEHDVCYAGTTPPSLMSKRQVSSLAKIGWEWDASLPRWWHYA